MSRLNKLQIKSPDGEDIPLMSAGIFLGTRGMPTGIELQAPIAGSAGFWGNLFIFLEDDQITFDLGRKTVPGRTQGILKEMAGTLFNDMRRFAQYMTTDPSVIQSVSSLLTAQRNDAFKELEKLPDLGLTKLPFLKQPDRQEAAVSAIFHELIATSLLKGYQTLTTGYKMTYDWWGTYRFSKSYSAITQESSIQEKTYPCVIEFKFSGDSVVDELESNKLFQDIDLIVCWDFDESRLAKIGITVQPVPANERFYHGTTHRFMWPASYNLGAAGTKNVISLRRLIEELKMIP